MKIAWLWAVAAASVVLGLAAMVAAGALLVARFIGPGALSVTGVEWSAVLGAAGPGLFLGGLLGILAALGTHAVLWRRANLSPRPPEPSP